MSCTIYGLAHEKDFVREDDEHKKFRGGTWRGKGGGALKAATKNFERRGGC